MNLGKWNLAKKNLEKKIDSSIVHPVLHRMRRIDRDEILIWAVKLTFALSPIHHALFLFASLSIRFPSRTIVIRIIHGYGFSKESRRIEKTRITVARYPSTRENTTEFSSTSTSLEWNV